MEVVFIDSEPPDAAGGGIRTYLRLALEACREAGLAARIYSHNPGAYPHERASPIGRRPCLRRPLRGLAYRMGYQENVLWEHARWLDSELQAGDGPGRVYEFCDFLGYGFFALRNPALRDRCILRVHTPNFLVASEPSGLWARWAARLGAWRERDCLERAARITVPSAEFVKEKLPWLTAWTHVPNPLPPEMPGAPLPPEVPEAIPALAAASGLAGQQDADWRAADEDPVAVAERNAPRPTRIEPDRFLYLGRVEERKGVLVLVRAFLRLAAERPYCSLTLVGGAAPGPYSASVRYLIESLPPALRPRVTWESPCAPDARPALFRRFTALVAPSLWENSPYVYFEAMAAGLHCIGSATGEMKAVAAITGSLTARPGDEEDLLRVLRAHCMGEGKKALRAQSGYLRSRRSGIPGQLIASWRAAAEGA
ncbi:MAG: family 2 glycosyl transferase [Fibrobacteres bacterium]|nr:family 2 glycosyl transferase [Fibrobacterota bacterium]